jgi:ABC-type Mn2+/Zn2+ transport system permease subunit
LDVQSLIEPFTLAFMQTALAAAVLIGVTNAVLGVHIVKRRMAFAGDALAHSTLPGLAIAQMLGQSLSLGAMLAAAVAAVAIHLVSRRRAIAEDTAIGVIFTGLFAVGIVLTSRTKSFRDLSHVLFGNVLGVTREDLGLIAGMTALIIAGLVLIHKELELTAYDPTHAKAIGLKPSMTRLILLILLALAVVTGIQVVGVILTSALLITPAATASLVARTLPGMMVIAVLVAIASSVIGLAASFHLQAPSGAAIVIVCTMAFITAAAVRKGRNE